MEDNTEKILQSAHSHPADIVARELGVGHASGLSQAEAALRLERDGPNAIATEDGYSLWRILIEQFSSIVVWLLAAAAAIAFFTDNALDGAAIVVVLLLNAAIGFAIEWQAGRSLEALKKTTRITARVRRDGGERIIDAEELVAGDVIILAAGDRVPADARIIESANLRADESTLTGESVPVEKGVEPVNEETPLAERTPMLFLGTTVVAGSSLAVVTATGGRTELGRIGKLVSEAVQGKTPLERKLEDLGKKLVYLVLGIAAVVFAAGALRGDGVWLMLEVAISLAVAAIPEGLPALTTLILALGVLRMARRNAIVRKLSAVEALGSATVICTDKTGTLTENRMTVSEYRLASGVSVEALDGPQPNFSEDESQADAGENLKRLLLVSVLCNSSSIEIGADGVEKPIGDPTETALLTASQLFGVDAADARASRNKILEHPFDSVNKRMTTVWRTDDEQPAFAAIKGAPGVIIEACNEYLGDDGTAVPMTEEKRREFLQINEEMAGRALRVLAFADKTLEGEPDDQGIVTGGTFLGFTGMTDPPREGAAESVRKAHAAGIRVVMLTGDQINTASSIAGDLDLGQGEEVFALHSSDLTGSDGDALAEMAGRATVFARVTPEDKLRIVEALQNAGEIVAVTGDGVNDAPALKQSDIGIAMGMRGTEVAKEAADIILTDDNFSTIVKAIEGGRTIYANIIKFVHLLFSDNLGEVLFIFGAIMIGLPLPLLPLQILWVNLVTDVFPALALAVEPAAPEVMQRPPHPPGEVLLSRSFLFLIFWKGATYASIVLAAYVWALDRYGVGAHARSVALFCLIGVQIGNLFNCRSRSRSAFVRFFSNPYIFAAVAISVGLQALAIYFTPLARILETTVPNAIDYAVIGGSIILPIIIVEITKAFSNRRPRH